MQVIGELFYIRCGSNPEITTAAHDFSFFQR